MTLNGEYVVVEAVQHEILESPVKVYNFEVAVNHTYFVGKTAVGVHNADCFSRGPNGNYEDASYHHPNSSGEKSPAPKNGQAALDSSIQIKPESPHRISINEGEFVVLSQTREGLFHGHVRTWKELHPKMREVLQKAGLVNSKGKIL